MTEVAILERRVANDPEDATAHYELAVLLQDARGYGLPSEAEDARLLERARMLLARAVHLDPEHARAHAALGFVLDQLGTHDQSLSVLLRARALDPKRPSVDVYVATTLVALDREEEALAEIEGLARRHKVNLKRHRAELAEASFPADASGLLGAFIHARNFLRSELAVEAGKVRNALDRGRRKRVAKAELDDCKAHQTALKKEFDAARVPEALRSLAREASTYGVGDDTCRPLLMQRIPKEDRGALVRKADRLAPNVHAWLDSFGGGEHMTVEAAAFMYLYEGIEELR